MRATHLVGFVSIAIAIGLVGAIVASSMEMGIVGGIASIVSTRWGVTTLIDAYIGLVIAGAWIASLERRARTGAIWFIALMLTGNLATLAYVAMRAFRARTVREIFIASLSERAPDRNVHR